MQTQIKDEMIKQAEEKEAIAKAVQDAAREARKKAQEIISDSAGEEEEEVDEDEDDEDEEEDGKSKKKTNKKDTKGKKAASKDVKEDKKMKAGEDPWGLGTREVEKDFQNLTCPPFELFEWGRLVVDEFTYVKEADHCVLTNLRANARWCLSGTTPIEKFYDVKSVASFLGIHLGVNEAPPTLSEGKQMTTSERMQYFRELYTNAWHSRRYLFEIYFNYYCINIHIRHQKAQEFLNRFVRQNIAEIDEIKSEEHTVYVELTPPERAIYLELEHYLQVLFLILFFFSIYYVFRFLNTFLGG